VAPRRGSRAAQVECFRNAAAHLVPGGWLVIENYIPALRRLPPGQTVVPFAVTPEHLGFEEYDIAARIAGLVLSERFADWNREPFTSDSASHVSVWEKP
jgi:hypothetical protein